MLTKRLILACIISGSFAITPSNSLFAQTVRFGGGPIVSALHPGSYLGSGSLAGAGLKAEFGLSSRIHVGLSGIWYLNAATESPATDHGRVYNLLVPSLYFRSSLIGEDNSLALLLDMGTMLYDLDAHGGDVARKMTVPTVGAGLGARVHLLGPMYLDIEGRDWITYVRPNHLGSTPGTAREVTHSPDLRVSLSFLLRDREPTLASFEDLPLSYVRDFRPISASAVRTPPATLNDHTHRANGTEVSVIPVAGDSIQPIGPVSVRGPIPSGAVSTTPPLPVRTTPTQWIEQKLATIYFELGSHDVDTKYRALIADVATYIETHPNARLALHGYTDSSGSIRFNLSLAERRGTTIQELLSRLYGIDPSRIDVVSKGIDFTAAQARQARRVDIIALIPK